MKRLINRTAYNLQVGAEKKRYIVTLQRLHNTKEGAPRFEAVIIDTEDKGSTSCPVYRFRGHYMGEYDEAAYILNCYLEGIK